MRKIKVLYVIDSLEFYGAERSLISLAKEFKNINPVFVHIYPGAALKKELTENNIKVYSLNIQEKYGFRKAVNLLSVIYQLEKPDLIHSTLFRADIITRKLKNSFKNIPLINSWVTNSYTGSRYKNKNIWNRLKLLGAFFMDLYSANKVDRFLANSKTIEETNRLALKISKSKTKVIYRGRELSKFHNTPELKLDLLRSELSLKDKKVLLNVGRLIPSKGQLDLIQVMPELIKKHPDVILLISGEGGFRKVLEAEIYDNKLEKHVMLLGARNDIPELLSIADYFVFPSFMEGLSGALIEAMMAGKFIIASDIPENLECVDESTALIFKTADKNDLLLKLDNALKKSSNHQELGKKAQEIARKKFEISNIAVKYESFYKRIVTRQIS